MRILQAFFLLGFSALAACGPQAPNLDSPGSTIVCFGDSITYGVGATPEEAYPAQLSSLLGTPAVNAGIPGETSIEGLRRLDEVLAEDPWLVIVEFGGNDLLQHRPIGETEASLRAILEALLEARVLPILVEIHGPFGGEMEDLFGELAADYGIPLLENVLPRILKTPRLKADPIHPNGDGYTVLAEELADLILPLLDAREKLR